MSAVDNLYNEMVNRLIRIKGSGDPNDNASLDPYAIGTEYRQTDEDPYLVWGKFTSGSNGWNLVPTDFIPPPNQLFVDANSIETFENGSEKYPYKSILTALEDWGRPTSYADATTPKRLFVHGGYGTSYTDNLTIYAGRQIYIEFFGFVYMYSNNITLEIDGTKDQGVSSILSISEAESPYALGTGSSAFLVNDIIGNEITPASGVSSVGLNLKKVNNYGSVNFTSATKTVNSICVNCSLKNVTGSKVYFSRIKDSLIYGTWSIQYAQIYDCVTEASAPSYAINLTASEFLLIVNTWHAPGITLTTPDLNIDRFSYDAGMEDGSLTIGTPGSVTMIDPPAVGPEFYVDAYYTGDYSNGAKEYPFVTAALARAADADAIIKLSGYIENADVDIGTEIIDEFPDTVGNNVEWNIVISKGANVEKLTAATVWDAGTDAIAALITDTTATIGTIDITLSCDLVADQVRLKATATSDDWSVKVIERTIS